MFVCPLLACVLLLLFGQLKDMSIGSQRYNNLMKYHDFFYFFQIIKIPTARWCYLGNRWWVEIINGNDFGDCSQWIN